MMIEELEKKKIKNKIKTQNKNNKKNKKNYQKIKTTTKRIPLKIFTNKIEKFCYYKREIKMIDHLLQFLHSSEIISLSPNLENNINNNSNFRKEEIDWAEGWREKAANDLFINLFLNNYPPMIAHSYRDFLSILLSLPPSSSSPLPPLSSLSLPSSSSPSSSSPSNNSSNDNFNNFNDISNFMNSNKNNNLNNNENKMKLKEENNIIDNMNNNIIINDNKNEVKEKRNEKEEEEERRGEEKRRREEGERRSARTVEIIELIIKLSSYKKLIPMEDIIDELLDRKLISIQTFSSIPSSLPSSSVLLFLFYYFILIFFFFFNYIY